MSQILSRAESLGAWLAIWEARRERDAHARRCVSDAMGAIDVMLRERGYTGDIAICHVCAC